MKMPNNSAEFYRTPAAVTRYLLTVESFKGVTWEPACGDGEISQELETAGLRVVSSDLHDRGYGLAGVDFLHADLEVENIVTNPPWSLASSWVAQSLRLARRKVALLLPLCNLCSSIHRDEPLKTIYVLPLSLTEPSLGWRWLGWHVWEFGHQGPITTIRPKKR